MTQITSTFSGGITHGSMTRVAGNCPHLGFNNKLKQKEFQ